MNQQAYLAALKRALSGLPDDQVADILRDYEQHFFDAAASGRNEAEVARALGDPRKIALEFKALTQLDALQRKHSLANVGRAALSLIYLAGFKLFLLPFMLVGPALLAALYLSCVCLFGGGAVLTASGLLGVDELAYKHDGQPTSLAWCTSPTCGGWACARTAFKSRPTPS